LKNDHATWAQWLEIRKRNGLDVAEITEWRVSENEARCRADLTKAIPAEKCKLWTRQFVWLGKRHLVVLDVVETSRPGIRHVWQLHAATPSQLGDRMWTLTNSPPQQPWADERLRPKAALGRLFCQTLLPRNYDLVVHTGGKAQLHDTTGRTKGEVAGNPFHLKFGKHVLQLDPGLMRTRTVFLNVLTATDAVEIEAPRIALQKTAPEMLRISVEDLETELRLPWALEE
jgi:hypothetical protein